MGAIHGRTQDTIVTPDGRFLTSLFVLFDLVSGIRAAQVHQETEGRVLLLVVPGEGWSDEQGERLTGMARDLLGAEMAVRLALGEETDLVRDPSGKLRPVIGLSAPEPDCAAS